MGTGITLSVLVVYIDNYLHLAASLPLILGAYSLSALAGVSLVVQLTKRIDKHRCWALCWFISAAVPPFFLFLVPGESALLPMIAGLVILGIASAGNMVMPIALLGDVIDYDIFKTQVNRSANYFSFNALLTKGNVAIGGGLAFYLLAAFGYEVGSDNSQGATNGLLFVALILPSIFSIIAGAILWFFPINRKRHAVILEAIEQRAAQDFQ
jgi:Na+/melibiose symporter-like transporter